MLVSGIGTGGGCQPGTRVLKEPMNHTKATQIQQFWLQCISSGTPTYSSKFHPTPLLTYGLQKNKKKQNEKKNYRQGWDSNPRVQSTMD